MANNLHVVPHGDKWAVRRDTTGRATRVVATEREAIDVARRIAESEGGSVIVHGLARRVRKADNGATNSVVPGDGDAVESRQGERKRRWPKSELLVHRHRRAPTASLAELRNLSGTIRLLGPAPSPRFLESER